MRPIADISDNHRHAIASTLLIVDRFLCQFEEFARGREASSVFHIEINDLTAPQANALRTQVEGMWAVMAQMRDDLHLESRRVGVRHLVGSHCSSIWENLVALDRKNLSGYGEPPEQLLEYLQPLVAELLDRLDHISRAMGE
jgi:hypothetical protein